MKYSDTYFSGDCNCAACKRKQQEQQEQQQLQKQQQERSMNEKILSKAETEDEIRAAIVRRILDNNNTLTGLISSMRDKFPSYPWDEDKNAHKSKYI